MSVRLFIGNLPYAASEAELREYMSTVGDPIQVVLPLDRETGRPRGFAFVDYADRGVAEEAIRRFNQQPFKGRPLAVSEARPREERPAGAPRPGGYSGGPPRPGGGGFAPRPGGFAPRPSDGGGSTPARSRNFGPDAPPKNKRKPARKDSDSRPRGRSRNGPSDGCTTPTKTGAPPKTTISTSITSRRAERTTRSRPRTSRSRSED